MKWTEAHLLGDLEAMEEDAPDQIFASQDGDGWRWPRASKFPEQGLYENIRYIRADLVDPAAIPALQARIEELEKQCSAYARADQLFVEDINELEAKLTKAVGFLKTMVDYNEYVIAPFLAELEGK